MVKSSRAGKDRTIESVVKEGFCTGCGTCAGICPVSAVDMVTDSRNGICVPRLNRETCTDCGLCLDACPGRDLDSRQLNLEVFGKEPDDVLLGNYLNCYVGHATDHDIRYNSSSGGMVTAILLHALETNLIDGALVTRMNPDRPLEPQPFIARTREEIISAVGSKYCPVPANIALKEILKAEAGQKFAVVGLPCHIHGVRRAEAVSKKLRERIVLHLGLVCSHTNTFQLTDFLLRRHGIHPEQVSSIAYRSRGWPGGPTVRTNEGREVIIRLHEYIVCHATWFFIPQRCTFCPDAFSEIADISFGDAWVAEFKNRDIGWSVFVSRNEIGEGLLRNAVSKGLVNAEKTGAELLVRSQIAVLYHKKKVIRARIRLFHRSARNPRYSLTSGPLDYLSAIYQQANASLLTSRPFLARLLRRVPTEILRRYGTPLALACKIQMGSPARMSSRLSREIMGKAEIRSARIGSDRTVEPVVKERFCTGCGTCAGICPVSAVDMVTDHHNGICVPRLNVESCTDCGLCLDACPGRDLDSRRLNLEIFGKEPEDILLGNYLNCYVGHATDHDIRYNSSSGGMVTALLLHALEKRAIDGALVTRMNPDRPLEPQPFIARTKEEIISAAGSKYCPVPTDIALKEILKAEAGQKFAVVGLPCHIHGVRKAEAVSRKLRERIVLHLGLFCGHSDVFQLTDFLLRRHGIRPEQVSRIAYRGRGWPGGLTVGIKGGGETLISYQEFLVLHSSWLFIPRRCTFCPDALSELADISFGDPWLPELRSDKTGHSVAVCRNEIGERLLTDAVAKGRVNLERTSEQRVVRSQLGVLYGKKKVLRARIRLSHSNTPDPPYSLPSSPLDYLPAVYQQANASLLTSRPALRGILKHIPLLVFRLYGIPVFVARRIQMRSVIRQRYPSS